MKSKKSSKKFFENFEKLWMYQRDSDEKEYDDIENKDLECDKEPKEIKDNEQTQLNIKSKEEVKYII